MPLRRFQCRLTIDFEVAVDSITEDTVHALAATYENRDEVASDPETWEWAARQRRLLHALVSRPDLLRRFVEARAHMVASEEAGEWASDGLEGGPVGEGGKREHDGFWAAVDLLSAEDRAFFEDRYQSLDLYEATAAFDEAFDVYPTRVTLDVDRESAAR